MDGMSEKTQTKVQLCDLMGGSLPADWKPSLTSAAREGDLRERVQALEREIADLEATIVTRNNVVQLAYEEIHRLSEMGGLESPFMDWMLSWDQEREEKK